MPVEFRMYFPCNTELWAHVGAYGPTLAHMGPHFAYTDPHFADMGQ